MAHKNRFKSGMQRRLQILLLVAGIGLFLVGGFLTGKEMLFQSRALKTTGIFTDSNGAMDTLSNKPSIVYLVKFSTHAGKTVEFYEMMSGEPLPDRKPLVVYYDPHEPNNARMLTRERWGMQLQLLAVGGLLGVCGTGMRFLGKRSVPAPAPITPTAG